MEVLLRPLLLWLMSLCLPLLEARLLQALHLALVEVLHQALHLTLVEVLHQALHQVLHQALHQVLHQALHQAPLLLGNGYMTQALDCSGRLVVSRLLSRQPEITKTGRFSAQLKCRASSVSGEKPQPKTLRQHLLNGLISSRGMVLRVFLI